MKASLKTSLAVIVAVGIFAGGYWSGRSGVNKEPRSSSTPTADMQGMAGMRGMPGMEPGVVMVSQQNQELLGIKTATVERRPMLQTIRAVGVVAYDERRVARVQSKIEGWVEKLYVNYTGELIRK